MRKAFNFYRSYYDVAKELTPTQREKFLWALLQKQFEGINPTDLEGMAKFAYLSQQHSIDSQVSGYEAKTGSTLGGSVGGSEGGSVQEKEKGQEEVEYTKGKTNRFIPPTISEVIEYCKHRNNDVDPHKWHDFYEGKGWMVGRNKMKNWKAAVRTWEKPKEQLKPLDRQEALRALNIQAYKDKLLKDGYTLEQIQEYAN